jgi:hypothetical protein
LADKPKLEYLDTTEVLSYLFKNQYVEALLPCIPSVRSLIISQPEKRILELVNWEKLRHLEIPGQQMSAPLLEILPHHKLTSLETLLMWQIEHEAESFQLLEKLPSFGMSNLRSISIRSRYGAYFRGLKVIAEANQKSLNRAVINTLDPRGHDPIKELFPITEPQLDIFGGDFGDGDDEPAFESVEWPKFPVKCLQKISLPIKYVRVHRYDSSVWGVLVIRSIYARQTIGVPEAEQLFLACYDDADVQNRLKELEYVKKYCPVKIKERNSKLLDWIVARIEIETAALRSSSSMENHRLD